MDQTGNVSFARKEWGSWQIKTSFLSELLRNRHELFTSAHSKSSQKNISKARAVLKPYADAKDQPGSKSVTRESSDLLWAC